MLERSPPGTQSIRAEQAAPMTLTEFEAKRCEELVAQFIERRRPPEHLRTKVDLAFRRRGQSIEIFEIRPQFQNPGNLVEHAIAKATYNKSKRRWTVFWQRADLRWHRYEPVPEVDSIEKFLAVVDEDAYSCFFG
jgi:hypothetical protein